MNAPTKTVLLDTNVVLDVWLRREPFAAQADPLFVHMEQGALRVFLCATTLPTLEYLACKHADRALVRRHIKRMLALVDIAPVTRAVLVAAADSAMSDFEDAVVAASAHACGVATLITRNARDFAKSGLRVYTPAQWLAADGD